MKLSEIVIQEAGISGSGPVEIKDVIKYFPSNHQKMIRALAKSGRLTYNGEALFENGEDTDALRHIIDTAAEYAQGEKIELEIQLDTGGHVGKRKLELSDMYDGDDDELNDKLEARGRKKKQLQFEGDDSFDIECSVDSTNQTWLGYNAQTNSIVVGFDMWLSENDFNDAWDDEFEKAFGVPFDHDEPEHELVFNNAWQEFKNSMFYGAVIEVDDSLQPEEFMPPMEGGFHRASLPYLKRKNIVEF